MPINTGESTLADLIKARNLSFAQFGVNNIERILAYDQAAWNLMVRELLGEFIEITTDQQRIYGASTDGVMQEVEEFGRSTTQRPNQGSQVAFPLRHYQYNLGWTREWWRKKTPEDLALTIMAGQKAHLRKIYGAVSQAIFGASNYTFADYTALSISFTIKRFLNADGFQIPDGPHGEIFNPNTHTHYMASSGLTQSAILALGNNVLEHKLSSNVIIAFNVNDMNTVLSQPGVIAQIDPRITLQYGTAQVPTERLDITQLNDRSFAILSPFALWVKPWIPQGYCAAWDAEAAEKPLCMRVQPDIGGPDLSLDQTVDHNPLHVQYQSSYFGVGAYCRTAMACLNFSNSVWQDPPITGY